ncbi:COG2426 family protein [Clostridium gasigenes]|uniref:COG2426 family protein n=1 Tax=Clostridium gasigenes TaxID=94869 RepID=UPI00143836AC|nr:small multi-drug export protein [Clostridium gasigenes]MBU3104662.1 small multi-drug export protein [Clostridium gasigenes]MBU3133743.1 small multi-drug export protein [Clostridium gasigenes]MBU3136830.1 small multi-drug export protein [Clostridium gasigenes]NKF06539.1 small multi-drug export protein [Clostridium gasigenes]QSW21105.1 small multi-drug export protein [Clostridium gasigenes]
MSDSLINWFTNNLSFMPKELVVLIISMVPILELRGGIIASSLLGINMFSAIWLCMLGNIIPIPFILWFITPIFTWMKKTKLLSGIVEKLEKKSMSKSEKIQKYEFWGLALFVGIPLPGTGAWTGALIASILGIKVKKASGSIFTGIIIATIIMTIISYGIPYAVGVFN